MINEILRLILVASPVVLGFAWGFLAGKRSQVKETAKEMGEILSHSDGDPWVIRDALLRRYQGER